jgi:hypothetical protein
MGFAGVACLRRRGWVPWIPQRRPRACGRLRPRRDPGRAEILFAIAAFAALCAVALSFAPRLVEPDDFAYTWTANGFVTTLMRVNQGPGRGIIGRLQPVPAGNPQIAPAAQAAHGTVWHHGVD